MWMSRTRSLSFATLIACFAMLADGQSAKQDQTQAKLASAFELLTHGVPSASDLEMLDGTVKELTPQYPSMTEKDRARFDAVRVQDYAFNGKWSEAISTLKNMMPHLPLVDDPGELFFLFGSLIHM